MSTLASNASMSMSRNDIDSENESDSSFEINDRILSNYELFGQRQLE